MSILKLVVAADGVPAADAKTGSVAPVSALELSS